MQSIGKRGLIWMLAMALVVAGLPMAHAMPDASSAPMHTAMQHHADMTMATVAMVDADHAHHHVGMVMDASSDQAMSDQDADSGPSKSDPSKSDPCKCLNCSMCVTTYVASPLRLSTPERRMVAVTYRMVAVGAPGIAVRVDPGIPILGM